MLAGRRRARARTREAALALVAAHVVARRWSSPAPPSSFTSSSPGSSRAPRSSITRSGWTLIAGAVFPLLRSTCGPRSTARRPGLRDDLARSRGPPLLRPRHRRDLRPPLASTRERRTDEPRAPRVLLVALALPAAAFAHASLRVESPAFGERMHFSPRESSSASTSSWTVLPNGDRRARRRRPQTRRAARAITRRDARRRCRALPRGPYTVRWRAMSLDGHVVIGRLHVRRTRRRATRHRRGRRAAARRRPSTSFAGSGSSGSRCSSAGSASGCSSSASRCRAARFYLVTGIGVVGVLEVAIAAFLLRCEDALQLPFADFLYGDLSPIAQGTRFGQAFIVDGARLRARGGAPLPRLADGAASVSSGPRSCSALGFASGLSLSGHSSASRRRESLADWLHLSAAPLDRRARAARRVVPARRARRAFRALLAARDGVRRACSSPPARI